MVEIWLLFSLVLPFLEVILQSYIHHLIMQAFYIKLSFTQRLLYIKIVAFADFRLLMNIFVFISEDDDLLPIKSNLYRYPISSKD
jgi:hypothetical protein